MPRLGGFLQFFLQLGFAFVQCLQTQLPAMQLDRELVDVTRHFRALGFVLFQLSAKFFCISMRVGIGFLRLGHERLLAALLAGQVHPPRRLVCDQRGFAVLAVKENVRIGFDFSDRSVRRLHEVQDKHGMCRRWIANAGAARTSEGDWITQGGSRSPSAIG